MPKPPPRTEWFLPLGLFLLFVAASPGRLISFDVAIRAETAHTLWTRGSVWIPTGSPVDGGLIRGPSSEAGTTFYGMGQVLALVPFDILGTLLELVTGAVEGDKWRHLPIALLYTPLVGLFWWWSVQYLLQALGFARVFARKGAALFALTTIVFVYSTQTAQEESLVGALAVMALGLWIRALATGHFRLGVLAGLCAGSVLLIRLNGLWSLLPLAGALWDARARLDRQKLIRHLVSLFAGTKGPLALFAIFSYGRFGHPFASGYDIAAAMGLGVFWTLFQWNVFWGLLFGLGKGLFVLSPLLLLAPWGWREAWRKQSGLGASIVVAFGASIVLCAFIANNPDGSECWGARYQVHLIGFLAAPALLGWQRLGQWSRPAAVAIGVLGILIQASSTIAPDAVEYIQNDRDGLSRTTLITSAAHGQLGRRWANIADWTSSGTTTVQSDPLAQMQAQYVPNIWGWSWGKKIHSYPLALAIAFAWSCVLLAAVALLLQGLLPTPKTR